MRPGILCLLVALTLPATGGAQVAMRGRSGPASAYSDSPELAALQVPATPDSGKPSAPQKPKGLIELTVRPAAVQSPALKYHLMPDFVEQTPGDAEQLYTTAILVWKNRSDQDAPEWDAWRSVPLAQFPRDAARAFLAKVPTPVLHYVELGARRERCHWDYPLRQPNEAFAVMMPALGDLRNLGKLLALRIRLELADGQTGPAIHDLQTGFALARHVGNSPILIHALVGVALGQVNLKQVETLIEVPGSPNLYWALTSLPSPFVDPRKAIEYEKSCLYLNFPSLQNLDRAQLSPDGWRNLAYEIAQLPAVLSETQLEPGVTWRTKLVATGLGIKQYPAARQYFLSRGYTPEQVAAMPAAQVLLIYQRDEYENYRDELFKWWSVPYPEARAGLETAEHQLESRWQASMGVNPFMPLLPAVSRAYLNLVRLDRQIAALRCIEAARAYAAGHDHRWPRALSEIKELPIPLDPMTGKEFTYSVDAAGVVFTLDAPSPQADDPQGGFRYQVTLAK